MVFTVTTLENSVFGTLTYGSRYWKCNLQLAGFEGAFTLLLRAGQKGPSVQQEQAFQRVQQEIITIKEAASIEVLRFHEKVQAPILAAQATPESIWETLVPDSIEVTNESYDDGRMTIFLVFTSLVYDDLTLALEVLDGRFVQITMI